MSSEPESPCRAEAAMGDSVKVSVARGPQPEQAEKPEPKPKEKEEEAPDASEQVDS